MNNSLFWGGVPANDLDGDLTIDRAATDRDREGGAVWMVALGRGSRPPVDEN